MDYQIDYQKYAVNFVVPAIITDDLAGVNADYLKVILQIFQTPTHNYSSSLLSTLLEMKESKVIAALQYWEGKGVLSLSGTTNTKQAYVASKKPTPVQKPTVPDNSEITFLMQAAEGIMGRPISSQERNTLLQICNVMNMPADIVVMVMQYCSEIGSPSMYKVEKICAEWAKEGITTHERAENRLMMLSERDSVEQNVARCLKVTGRGLSKTEAKYAHTWVEEWGFKYDMISEAYEITVNQTGGLSLAYMNKVLENWSRTGIRTPEEIKKWNWQGSGSANGRTTPSSYSRDELEDFWNKN